MYTCIVENLCYVDYDILAVAVVVVVVDIVAHIGPLEWDRQLW